MMTAFSQNHKRNTDPYHIPTKHQQHQTHHHAQNQQHSHSHNQSHSQSHRDYHYASPQSNSTHHIEVSPSSYSQSTNANNHNGNNAHNQSYSQQHHRRQSSHISSPPLSASVPTLSREFVVRRISEGETGRLKEELRCEACGKGYKHISSLAKHLWEHTPEWNVTKKLLISKHQQVQLLEAASILVGMNEGYSSTPSPIKMEENNAVEEEDEDVHHISLFKNDVEDEDEDENTSRMNLKYRSHSVSQHPPIKKLEPMSPTLESTNQESLNGRRSSMMSSLKSPINSTHDSPIHANFKVINNNKDGILEEGIIGQMDD